MMAELAANLRKWVWDAARGSVGAQADGGASRHHSTWGHTFEVHSMTGIQPADVHTRDVGAALVRMIDNLIRTLAVERPGGLLVVRGSLDPEDVTAIPEGIQAEVARIGEHALKVRLAIVGHAVTLEEARARTRPAA
jgi:hypothetical protein